MNSRLFLTPHIFSQTVDKVELGPITNLSHSYMLEHF